MEYITVDNGIITGHFCAEILPEGAIQVPQGFPGWQGLNVNALTEDYTALKPISQQVSEGVAVIPEGYKINATDSGIIRMSQEELDEAYPAEVWALPDSYAALSVHARFDGSGNLGYTVPEGYVKMSENQPKPYYKAISDGTWSLDLDFGKKLKLEEVNAAYDLAVDLYMRAYPNAELLTFDKQEKEAREWTADNSVATPFLDGLAAARGIDKPELVQRVIVKADAFQTAIATLTGTRQKYEDTIEAATTEEELDNVVPSYELL